MCSPAQAGTGEGTSGWPPGWPWVAASHWGPSWAWRGGQPGTASLLGSRWLEFHPGGWNQPQTGNRSGERRNVSILWVSSLTQEGRGKGGRHFKTFILILAIILCQLQSLIGRTRASGLIPLILSEKQPSEGRRLVQVRFQNGPAQPSVHAGPLSTWPGPYPTILQWSAPCVQLSPAQQTLFHSSKTHLLCQGIRRGCPASTAAQSSAHMPMTCSHLASLIILYCSSPPPNPSNLHSSPPEFYPPDGTFSIFLPPFDHKKM